jgi:hypothetical protein
LKAARKELLVYCAEISDVAMIRLLQQRVADGVHVRIIGRVTRKNTQLEIHKPPMRLHTRTFIRDGECAFIGSQGLRKIELDSRREIGIVFRHPAIVKKLAEVFEEDWALPEPEKKLPSIERPPAEKVAKRVAKKLVSELPPVTPVIREAIKEVVGEKTNLDPVRLEEAVKSVVKEAVKDAVADAVQEVVEEKVG